MQTHVAPNCFPANPPHPTVISNYYFHLFVPKAALHIFLPVVHFNPASLPFFAVLAGARHYIFQAFFKLLFALVVLAIWWVIWVALGSFHLQRLIALCAYMLP